MTTQFGIRLPISGPLASSDAVTEVAQTAEALGYDSVWVHDFIAWTKTLDRTHVSSGAIELIKDDTVPVLYESLMTLAFVAAKTSTIKIGTAILCLPYRNPVIAAKQLSTLDELSKGRLIAGVGVGGTRKTNNQDFEIVGVSRTEKYDRTRDYIQAMKALWEQSDPVYSGRYVDFPQTVMFPKPVQSPLPLWFGGKGDKSLDLAADFGTGWLPTWMVPEQYEELVPALHARLTERGRRSEDFVIAKEGYTCIAETRNEAVETARATMATFSSGFTVQTEEHAWASNLIGDSDDIIRGIKRFQAVGVEHFEMKFIYRSMDELTRQLTLFSNEVMPAVR